MVTGQKRATVSPTLRAFGRQLRRYRDGTRLSQERAGQRAGVTGQYVGLVETGKTRCRRDFATVMDKALGAGGALVSLWDDLVMDAGFPTWFDWHVVEGEAIAQESYSMAVVHGLLQTRGYASSILHGNEEAVEARLKRQAVLTREDPLPPAFALLLDEGALYREAGNAEIMREQLTHLVAMSARPGITIQIVPARAEHGGNSGSFNVATLEDRSEVAYVETAARGITMGDSGDLTALHKTLLELRSIALPVGMSADLIRRTAEERWT
jgi:transcriptional regulator with XRE-family HTH domain